MDGHELYRRATLFPYGISRLKECDALIALFGKPFVSAFTIVKEAEYEVFLQVISSWEREHLLLNV